MSARTLRPITDHVLIRRAVGPEMSPGGIVIPDNAKEKPAEGEVLAVGSGKVNKDGSVRAPQVMRGDCVLFTRYNAIDVELDGEKYVVVHEDEILAVLQK